MVAFKSAVSTVKTFGKHLLSEITVEPLMLLDGLAFSNMHVYIENLQMDRVCRVSAGFSEEVCRELKAQPDASVEVHQKYSVFALYNSIIAAALPLFFILFMGAWSDKYGRKVPLVAVQFGHILHAGGYLLASLAPSWPAEFLLLVTLLDTLGGGAVSFLTAANSYIGDVSSEESRTSRVGLANSIWFLGGPAGTLLGTYIYNRGGYLPLFATSLTFSFMAAMYIIFFLHESHGPFARKKTSFHKASLSVQDSVTAMYGLERTSSTDLNLLQEDITLTIMMKDFFSLRHILDSFKSTLRKREGNTRSLILLLIFTSLLRRLTRSPYVFAFTRHVLGWKATDYSLWVTYKNLVATTGSLIAVPLLSVRFGMSDNLLAMVGSMSGLIEYIVYGCVSEARSRLIWFAPIAALLLNSCTIAQRAMMTKFVTRDEIGKVSAVLGALDGMMPMVNSVVYTTIYHASVSAFPAAHFFLGATVSILMIAMFCIIIRVDKTRQYDVEGAKPTELSRPIKNKSLLIRTDSRWLATVDTVALEVVPCHGMSSHHTNIPLLFEFQDEIEVSSNLSNSRSWPKKVIQNIKRFMERIFNRKDSSGRNSRIHVLEKKPNILQLFTNINHVTNSSLIPRLSQNPSKKSSMSCNNHLEDSDKKMLPET